MQARRRSASAAAWRVADRERHRPSAFERHPDCRRSLSFHLAGGFASLYTQLVLMNIMGQYIMYACASRSSTSAAAAHPVLRPQPGGSPHDARHHRRRRPNELFTAGFVAIFGDIFVLAGIVGVVFWLNWRLALVLSPSPVLVLVSIWFRRGARLTYRQVRARIAAINAFLQEHISGCPPCSSSIGRRKRRRSSTFSTRNTQRQHRLGLLLLDLLSVIELIETIGVALIVWYGGGRSSRARFPSARWWPSSSTRSVSITDLGSLREIQHPPVGHGRQRAHLQVARHAREDRRSGLLEVGEFESLELRNVCSPM